MTSAISNSAANTASPSARIRVDGVLAEEPGMKEAVTGYGIVENSGEWSGLTSEDAQMQMAAHAEHHGFGKAAITYRIKDWGISRQRYWGTPIPVIHCRNAACYPCLRTNCLYCCRRTWPSPARADRRLKTTRPSST